MTKIKPAAVRRSAMDLLARREHSFQELHDKLRKRYPDHPELIQGELEKLQQQGLQSDSRMVEAFVRSRISRGQGPLKISAELRNRGISDRLIELGLNAAEVDWLELISQVAERKFGETEVNELKEKARRARFLQQRGFSFDQISVLLN